MAHKYIRGNLLGEGTWGKVYEASDRNDKTQMFAIKMIKQMDKNFGLNFTALREIKHLQVLKSVNIIKVMLTIFNAVLTNHNVTNKLTRLTIKTNE
jgi:serine/threonine protein kinase